MTMNLMTTLEERRRIVQDEVFWAKPSLSETQRRHVELLVLQSLAPALAVPSETIGARQLLEVALACVEKMDEAKKVPVARPLARRAAANMLLPLFYSRDSSVGN